MEWLILIGIAVMFSAVYQSKKQKKEKEEAERNARKAESDARRLLIADLADKAQLEFDKIATLKSNSAKANAPIGVVTTTPKHKIPIPIAIPAIIDFVLLFFLCS